MTTMMMMHMIIMLMLTMMLFVNLYHLQRFMENASISVCLNELQTLERNEVCCQIKLRATAALFAATEQSNDAIEITSENFEVQVLCVCVCVIR